MSAVWQAYLLACDPGTDLREPQVRGEGGAMWIETLKVEAYYRTWRLRRNPFAGIEALGEDVLPVKLQAPPDRRYVIFFTPRSGSSRLTDLMSRTRVLGHPGESFGPKHLPKMAKVVGATDMARYVDRQVRRHATKGVYGVEVTYAHLLQAFASPGQFLDLMRPTATIWLIREDIVAQAVSAARMVQTGTAHLVGDEVRQEGDFRYDSAAIARYITRLFWMERRSEAMFQRHGLRPFRLSYERMIATPDADLLAALAAHVGSAPLPETPPQTVHRKLGDEKNADFAAQFRATHPRLMRRIDAARAPMLARLDRTSRED